MHTEIKVARAARQQGAKDGTKAGADRAGHAPSVPFDPPVAQDVALVLRAPAAERRRRRSRSPGPDAALAAFAIGSAPGGGVSRVSDAAGVVRSDASARDERQINAGACLSSASEREYTFAVWLRFRKLF